MIYMLIQCLDAICPSLLPRASKLRAEPHSSNYRGTSHDQPSSIRK